MLDPDGFHPMDPSLPYIWPPRDAVKTEPADGGADGNADGGADGSAPGMASVFAATFDGMRSGDMMVRECGAECAGCPSSGCLLAHADGLGACR